MIIGIGIDLVDKLRIESVIERKGEKFLARILHENERARLPADRERLIEYIAGRFAAKEAAAKALGTGIGIGLSWREAEITVNQQGKPSIQWSKRVLDHYPRLQLAQTFVSISHEKKYVVAQVIIEG